MAKPTIATKQMIEEIFDGAAARYDREGPEIFRQSGAQLVEFLAIPPGARVLDIATGTGAVLVPACKRVGATGRVIGLDLSSAMLEVAEQAARGAGESNFQLHKMDAERLEFSDGSFDVVTCAFSLFFFSGLDAAFGEMRRVLRSGGRVGISVFGRSPAPFDPAWRVFAEQAQAYEVVVRTPQRVSYLPDELRSLLEESGFSDIAIQNETREVVYANEDEWWAFQLTLANRAAILSMNEETRARFKREYLDRVRPLFQSDGLHLPLPVIYAIGHRA